MGTRPQHDPTYRRLCTQLRRWREEAGLTQRELGKRLKRPHTFVHKTETGDRRIDPVEFGRWCSACGQNPGKALLEVLRL